MAIKAETLQRILSDADSAQEVPNMKNTYAPEEYQKVMAKKNALGLINDGQNNGYYQPNIDEGSVEFDEFGNLRALGRTQPVLLDVNRYTANRYKVERVTGVTTKTKGVPVGTYIIAVFGEGIVSAINSTNELPPSIKAFRFVRKEEGETVKWEYVKSEFVPRDEVYKMTKKLAPDSALELIQQVTTVANSSDDNVDGDSLDDIA